MRKVGLLFCLFCGLNLCAQNYLNESSRWYTVRGDIFDNWYTFSHYAVIGDTLIEGKTYHEIQQSYDYLWLEMFSPDTIQFQEDLISHIYIREDSLKFYKRNNGQDQLIVDFDLDVGDAVGDGWYDEAVVSIDTIYLNGEVRKVFNTSFGEKIYEGIGTSKGLEEGLTWLGDEAFGLLKCFVQDGDTLELHAGNTVGWDILIEDCWSLSSAVEEEAGTFGEGAVKVFPNPADAYVTIVGHEKASIKKVTFVDLYGKILLEKDWNNEVQVEIKLNNKMSKGCYWVLIADENGKRSIVKFVKI